MTGPNTISRTLVASLAHSTRPATFTRPAADVEEMRSRERWEETDKHRRQVAAALSGMTVADVDELPDGRVAVRKIRLIDGSYLSVEGRHLSPAWAAHPSKTALSIGSCGSAYAIMRNKGVRGAFEEQALSCGVAGCPRCQRRHAVQRVEKWLPSIMALHGQDCQIAFLTLTLPTMEGKEPVHMTKWERDNILYDGAIAEPGSVAVSTTGASLTATLDNLAHKWSGLRDRSSSRDWWQGSVIGGLASTETTARTKRCGAYVFRWHTHLHVLIVLRPGVIKKTFKKRVKTRSGSRLAVLAAGDDPWFGELLGHWCRDTGAKASAQKCELITAQENVRRSAVEVLKYPAKLATMTTAQKADWMVSTKGRRLSGLTFGAFNGNSRFARLVKWLAVDDDGSSIEDKRSALLRCDKAVPPPLQKVFKGMTQATRRSAEALAVVAREGPPPKHERRQFYIQADDAGSASVEVPGFGFLSMLTRLHVCELFDVGLSHVRAAACFDGTWVWVPLDLASIVADIRCGRVPETVKPPPLIHGGKPVRPTERINTARLRPSRWSMS